MRTASLVISADYADALLSAKRGKNILFVIILLLLLCELAMFFVARYTTALNDLSSGPASQLRYLVGLIDFLGLILPVVLTIAVWAILQVLVMGRLLGAGKLVSAFLWSVLLIVLLFPWQSVLNNPAISQNAAMNRMGEKIPGVLYTWAEFASPQLGPKFVNKLDWPTVLHWARYVGFPVLAILILLMVQAKSSKGLRQAMVSEDSLALEPPADI